MVRTYHKTLSHVRRGKHYTPYRHYTKEILNRAVQTVKNGSTILVAADQFHVPKSTISRVLLKQNEYENPGRPLLFTEEEERHFVNHLNLVSSWGYPFDLLDLRLFLKAYLDKKRKILTTTDPSFMVNFDETNLTDNPGNKKFIFKRGTRYPEHVINSTKSAISLMYAGTADGQLLSIYVVYKGEHLWDSWTLQKKLDDNGKVSQNLISGFAKTGMYPFDPSRPKQRLPSNETDDRTASLVSHSIVHILKEMQRGNSDSTEGKKPR
ncbi:hypothetical protein NQ314_018521 [Rhamnusium bicolor]|uniref:HTH psq-type domain-containing protein n=1 Tax=Rhamnusium bicolor TaxID=1586634 RepID=A0AAV8WPZ9_9CUCU|nr:hypothetical protein NQ314_018521 [Rhamnusium bicolor]